jgi:hypothetical protein
MLLVLLKTKPPMPLVLLKIKPPMLLVLPKMLLVLPRTK